MLSFWCCLVFGKRIFSRTIVACIGRIQMMKRIYANRPSILIFQCILFHIKSFPHSFQANRPELKRWQIHYLLVWSDALYAEAAYLYAVGVHTLPILLECVSQSITFSQTDFSKRRESVEESLNDKPNKTRIVGEVPFQQDTDYTGETILL